MRQGARGPGRGDQSRRRRAQDHGDGAHREGCLLSPQGNRQGERRRGCHASSGGAGHRRHRGWRVPHRPRARGVQELLRQAARKLQPAQQRPRRGQGPRRDANLQAGCVTAFCF